MKFLYLLIFIFGVVRALPKEYSEKEKHCGYESCPKIDPNASLNVHIVPHSHDDVGWLKTVDQYYHGTKSNIQHAGVEFILDSVIQALLKNPERRFVQVETAFFWKWWQDQNEDIRNKVKFLVNSGQLEFIGGGWSMNDEGASHYQSTIDQFTWGFRKLSDTLGTCARPKIGWQIDPFGHSREQASLSAQLGFDGMFFARLDWRDKDTRLKNKTMEILWQGSQSLGESSQLFTSVLYNHYMGPPGFCFDLLCSDIPIVDDKKSPEYNADSRAKEFYDYVVNQHKYFKTNNIIISMGGDFHYQDALYYFSNIDRLISSVNNLDVTPKVNVFYSSPACYIKAINEANLKWTVKTDDFFPYASDHHSYWSGYFSSRPTSKRFERFGNNLLQVSKQLSTLAGLNNGSVDGLDPLREAMGMMQHHDAITGTEKQHVADDYARILSEAFEVIGNVATDALKKISIQPEMQYHSCLLLNISQCEVTENNDKFLITIYNPLSRPITEYIRIPVPKEGYSVTTNNQQIITQSIPIIDRILNIPGRNSSAKFELYFQAENLPPLGYRVYLVQFDQNYQKPSQKTFDTPNLQLDESGHLVTKINNGSLIFVSETIMYYNGATGNNNNEDRSSGAYIFRPKTQEAMQVTDKIDNDLFEGPLVKVYHQKFNDWVAQVIRIHPAERDFTEYQWIVGPIPVKDGQGKEIIARFSSNLKTEGVFYTDANGREMIQRRRDHRNDYTLTFEEPVAQNYYPVTSKIYLKDEETGSQIGVMNDRAQGGSSLKDGDMELMIHRRLLRDDAFGVGEALNEQAYGDGLIATGSLYMKLNFGPQSTAQERLVERNILLAPWTFFSTGDKYLEDHFKWEFSGLTNALPDNIQILTLEPWGDKAVLLRLEHIMERGDDLAEPVTVDLNNLFSTFKIQKVQEMALGGNQLLAEVNRLKWNAETEQDGDGTTYRTKSSNNTMEVTLNAMEIKTFIINIEPSM